MRFRSEWLTLLTLTLVGAGALACARLDGSAPAGHAALPSGGIDPTPTGTIRATAKAHPAQAKLRPAHP